MGSRKRSARRKEREAFLSGTGGLDDAFARAGAREGALESLRERVRRTRACERKNRYETRADAQEAIAACSSYGRTGLHCYKCPYCGGWHLTSRQGGPPLTA